MNFSMLPPDLKRKIISFRSRNELLRHDFEKDIELWYILLKEDFNFIPKKGINPFEAYLDKYSEILAIFLTFFIQIYIDHFFIQIYIDGSALSARNTNVYLADDNTSWTDIQNNIREDWKTFKANEYLSDINVDYFINQIIEKDGPDDVLLLNEDLNEITLENISEYVEDERAHGYDEGYEIMEEYTKIDEKYWEKYKGKFVIENKKGITLKDLMKAVFMVKSAKFDTSHEFFGGMKITSLKMNKKRQLILSAKLQFDSCS